MTRLEFIKEILNTCEYYTINMICSDDCTLGIGGECFFDIVDVEDDKVKIEDRLKELPYFMEE